MLLKYNHLKVTPFAMFQGSCRKTGQQKYVTIIVHVLSLRDKIAPTDRLGANKLLNISVVKRILF